MIEVVSQRIRWVMAACIVCGCAVVLSPHRPAGVAALPAQAMTWQTGRKMGVGAALSAASSVWFTLTDGALSEVYYPTTDTPNLRSLSFIVTDGHSFVNDERISTAHAVRLLTPTSLAYVLTNTDLLGRYRLTTIVYTDPARSTVLLHTRLTVLKGATTGLWLGVVMQPIVNGTTDGNTLAISKDAGRTVLTASNAQGAYGPVALALAASTNWMGARIGPPPDARHVLALRGATGGPIDHADVETGLLPARAAGDVTLALGFGRNAAAATNTALASLAANPRHALSDYTREWASYAASLRVPQALSPALKAQFLTSALVLRSLDDKTYGGAIIASPTIPWGEAQSATQGRLGGYHLVWARDLYEIATGLLAAGDTRTAHAALTYLLTRQEDATGMIPQNTWLDGSVHAAGIQMDQLSYPLILAWQLGVTDATTYRTKLRPMARLITQLGPSTQEERWEEIGGYSPSTIAAEIAGLTCAASIAARNNDALDARYFQAVADDWAREVKSWTVTTSGPLAPYPYFIRVDDNTNPNDGDVISLANNGGSFDERTIVDAGFLELVRLGILPATDSTVRQSLAVVDRTIRVQTPVGPAWYRYNHDGYGEQVGGAPYTGAGQGRLWPVLTGERGEYELQAGHASTALSLLTTMARFSYGAGMLPEQVWDTTAVPASPPGTDPTTASIGLAPGVATGSATPLDWSMAQYLRLAADLGSGRLLDMPTVVATHYLAHTLPAGPPLHITQPARLHTFNAPSPIQVRGSTLPGVTVLLATSSYNGNTLRTLKVDGQGRFAAAVTLDTSENDLTVVAIGPHGGSTLVQRVVIRQP